MIENLKDLQKFFKLCREQGITKADLTQMQFEFGDITEPVRAVTYSEESSDPYKNFPQGVLSPEELAFYSAGGVPPTEAEAS